MFSSKVSSKGRVSATLFRNGVNASVSWKLRNWVRPSFMWNFFTYKLAFLFSKLTRVITITGRLSARKLKEDGTYVDYGVVAHGLVTTAFVEYQVDEMVAETTAWGDFKFHDSGVGTTAAAVGDTDIETTDAVARSTGTQLEGATGEIYKSVGTITYGSTLAITEHGIFNIATAGILLDRHVFSAINVVDTDQIEFTYELTINDGG